MLTKHDDHVCKECQQKFSSFMELLKHVAKQHHKEQSEVQDIVPEEDEFKVVNISKHKGDSNEEEDEF